MNNIRHAPGKSFISMRWMTRLSSIVVSSVFLLIIYLAVTDKDKPQGAAIPILALLVPNIVGCFAAWRWEQVGGIAVVISALCLSVVAYSASLTFGLGSQSFLSVLIYGAPFLAVGILFWVCGQRAASGSHHDLAPPPLVLRRWWFIGAMLAIIVALTVIIVALVTGVRLGG